MNCDEARQQLKSFLSGSLSGDDSREVRRHLASCSRCAALLTPVDRVELLPALDEMVEPSAELPARFRARLEEHALERAGKARWSLRGWMRAAGARPARLATAGALAVVVLAAGIVLYNARIRETGPSEMDITIAQNLTLLQDMDVIENLDMLEDFDAIENMPAGAAGVQ